LSNAFAGAVIVIVANVVIPNLRFPKRPHSQKKIPHKGQSDNREGGIPALDFGLDFFPRPRPRPIAKCGG